MKHYVKFLILLILLTSVSLSQTPKSEFKEKKILKSLNNCNADSLNCTYVKVDYIEMVSGKHKEKINNFIKDITIRYTSGYGDRIYSSIEEAAESFVRDFSEFEYYDSTYTPNPWYNEVSVVREKSPENVICLTFSQGIFTGGAHPGFYLFTYNISTETGDTVQFKDIFIKGFEKKLDRLLDKKYRKINGFDPNIDLQEEGLFVSKIEHNNNFAILNEGVRFFYNQYEIAAYVAGTTEIILTYKELSNIIKEGGILDQ